jgi:hypothetical protein
VRYSSFDEAMGGRPGESFSFHRIGLHDVESRVCFTATAASANAGVPNSTLSSQSVAFTTSMRARDQFVICRRNAAFDGPKSASPALLMCLRSPLSPDSAGE